jgi:hypothetical protein
VNPEGNGSLQNGQTGSLIILMSKAAMVLFRAWNSFLVARNMYACEDVSGCCGPQCGIYFHTTARTLYRLQDVWVFKPSTLTQWAEAKDKITKTFSADT